jgi:hypothetical protein
MAIEVLQELIDKQDNWEVVRNQIAAILVAERDNQKTLAGASSADYDFEVYLERFNPWEKWLNTSDANPPSQVPIVNVWVDNTGFDGLKSNTIERQTENAVYNIDIYALGVAKDDGGTGHTPGDQAAAFERDRVVRLVRNILMSGQNAYLQLRGLVGKRWPNSIDFFQPEQDGVPIQQVAAARISFGAQFNEFSPQYVPTDLEIVGVELNYEQQVIDLQYNYPLP